MLFSPLLSLPNSYLTSRSSRKSINKIVIQCLLTFRTVDEKWLHCIGPKQRTTVQIMENTWTMAIFHSWPTIQTCHLHLNAQVQQFNTFSEATRNKNGTEFTLTLNYHRQATIYAKIEVHIFGASNNSALRIEWTLREMLTTLAFLSQRNQMILFLFQKPTNHRTLSMNYVHSRFLFLCYSIRWQLTSK